jgi:DNA-directed RNA polymerase sigma subunit (sigma70/sigma32)
MGLVRSIVFRYRNLGVPEEDLVQEGAIGLLTAVDDYDPARGTSFSTYAFWRAEIATDLHLSPERTRALKDEALRELAVDLTAAASA